MGSNYYSVSIWLSLKTLQTQADFCWNFSESCLIVDWLLLKDLDITKFCGKIAIAQIWRRECYENAFLSSPNFCHPGSDDCHSQDKLDDPKHFCHPGITLFSPLTTVPPGSLHTSPHDHCVNRHEKATDFNFFLACSSLFELKLGHRIRQLGQPLSQVGFSLLPRPSSTTRCSLSSPLYPRDPFIPPHMITV